MAWARAACYTQILGFAQVNSLCNVQLEGSVKSDSVITPYFEKVENKILSNMRQYN